MNQIISDLNSGLTPKELNTEKVKNFDKIGAILWPENYIPIRKDDISEVLSDTPKIDKSKLIKLIYDFETKSSKLIEEQQ
jgi:hypothetical protein